MAEENAYRFERMEKAQQELREQLAKTQEENREQLSRMMELILKMAGEKGAATGQSTRTEEPTPQENSDPVYPPGFTPPQGNQAAYQAPPPAAFAYPYAPQFMGQTSGQVPFAPNTGASPSNPQEVPDLDDPREREKLQKNTTPLPESSEAQQKYELLEERLRAIEGINIPGIVDISQLGLVSNFTMPQKFKVPEFEKYDGNTCPLTHLHLYARKMEGYSADEKLLIHCFQYSLAGPASRWYVRLDRKHIRSWNDLAHAFIAQYKHVLDMAPDRMSLQNMKKKPDESFREYAQRWREMAAQVQPPLTEKEVTKFFVNTFCKTPYYQTLLASASKSFADMMVTGEMLKSAIKNGMIECGESSRRAPNSKKKEGEAQAVFNGRSSYNFAPTPNHASYQPYPPAVNNVATNAYPYTYQSAPQVQQSFNNQSNSQNKTRESKPRERIQFDPIPVSYTELLPRLLENQLVAKTPLEPLQPPYPKWYDANARCDYHYGIQGHSTENCTALKFKVQALIKNGLLNFANSKAPNVSGNPLPNHGGGQINAIMGIEESRVKRDVNEVEMSMVTVFKALTRNGFLEARKREWQPKQDVHDFQDQFCEYHASITGHEIQECQEFRNVVQALMDQKLIEFSKPVKEELVNVIIGEQRSKEASSGGPKPLTILYQNKSEIHDLPQKAIQPKLTVEVPGSFPYKNDKAVPWNYDCVYLGETAAADLSGVGGMTRSGRIYSPSMAEKAAQEKIVDRADNQESVKGKETVLPEAPKRQVSEKEACEFLKFIKHSEYSVVEQLNKLPARISLLSLLLNSEPHRNALLRVLNEAYVAHNTSVDKIEQLVGNITTNNFITFNDEEIPPEGRGSTKALYITVKCKDFILPRALIDNGSSLNVLPMNALSRLPVDSSHMKKSHIVVRAFDGTKREVIGNIELPIQIGPCTFNVEFQVMDINPSYNCLLGRPWIHMAGAVPSTLHQKIKFIIGDKLISIAAEEDMIAATSTSTPYLDVDHEAVESSFQALELVNATFVGEKAQPPMPRLSKTTKMSLKMVIGRGAKAGLGLGKYLQGGVRAISVMFKQDRYGLGYKPNNSEKKRQWKLKQEGRIAKLEGREEIEEPMDFPPLCETFRSIGYLYPSLQMGAESGKGYPEGAVHMVSTDNWTNDIRSGIRPSNQELNNWTATDLLVLYRESEK